MIEPERHVINFKTVLEGLMDMSKPFPPAYLHSFSDLNPRELASLAEIWPKVSTPRRQALLEDLEDLADAETLVSFDEVGRFALKDEDAVVRALAIRLLWDAQDRKLVPPYIDMMENDPDVEVRATAATALGTYVYLGEVEEIPSKLLTNIEDGLLRVFVGKDTPLVRRRALESLGYSSRPEVPDIIRESYELRQPEWTESSLFAMGRSADTVWEPQVLSHLDNPNEAIRTEAIQAAGELELASARQPLLDMLEEEPDNDEIWAATVWSLSQIGGEDVRPTLQKLMDETEDTDEMDFLEEALDNLSFTDDMALFDLFEVDPDESETHIIDQEGNPAGGDLPDDHKRKKKPKNPR